MKKGRLINIAGAILAVSGFLSCANITAPTGGVKDDKAPVMLSKNFKDSSLNFQGGKIQMEFDEFVQLKDVANQLVITPLLKSKPKLEAHKRKVTLYLPDSLLEKNTTYKINFGESILDMHESNAIKNVVFTFSTGTYFDSLVVKGQITEANTGLPDTASWIALYDGNKPDSVLTMEKPMYIVKSFEGKFQIQNLPNRPFKIFALRDKNANLKYDDKTEWIAFHPQPVNPSDTNQFIKLWSYMEGTDTMMSKLKNLMEKPAVTVSGFNYQVNADTLISERRTFELFDTLQISFGKKLMNVDKSKIRLYHEEVLDATASIELDSTKKKIKIKTEWQPDAKYSLQLGKGFATDSVLMAKPDTFYFRTKRIADYGFLTVKHATNTKHVMELYSGSKKVASRNMKDTIQTFKLLLPGEYRIQILEDDNENGVWDPGSWVLRKQPEITRRIPQSITIKANWENKIDVNASEKKPNK